MYGQVTPAPAPMAPQNPQQSQMLAQVLQQMKAQPNITTPQALGSNMVASALNTFSQQGAGQGGAQQWRTPGGAPSGNWMNSPLGQKLGGMFGLGQAAGGGAVGSGPGGAITLQPGNGSGMAPYSVNPQTGLVSPGAPS